MFRRCNFPELVVSILTGGSCAGECSRDLTWVFALRFGRVFGSHDRTHVLHACAPMEPFQIVALRGIMH